jgi:hypothetical protein
MAAAALMLPAVKHGAFIATQLIPRFDLAPASEDYVGFMYRVMYCNF